MPSLTIPDRNFVIHMRTEGHGYGTIVSMLQDKGTKTSRTTVKKLWRKFQGTGLVTDKKRVREGRFGTQEHKDFIDLCMSNHPDMTAKILSDRIMEQFGIRMSDSRINTVRRDCGWIQKGTRYCQLIRHANKEKRVEWCTRMLQTEEKFDDVVFTDESRIEINFVGRRCYRKMGQPVPRIPKAKHPFSFLVWGGISRRGCTPLVIFNGIMVSDFYQEKILQSAFLPFVQAVYPESHRLFQDNDPKHTSRSTKAFMEEHGVNWWRSPAESPDLNPIENLWSEMKVYCNTKVRPKNKEELRAAIHQFWGTVTPEKCQRYINHLYTVMPVVIENNGEACGF